MSLDPLTFRKRKTVSGAILNITWHYVSSSFLPHPPNLCTATIQLLSFCKTRPQKITVFNLVFPILLLQLDGSTYGGSVQTSLGGVGRNISDAILRLGQQCLLITAVGNDRQGQLVRENNPNAVSEEKALMLIRWPRPEMTDAENDRITTASPLLASSFHR